jgi:putative SOS response-associated peptidase YedK
LSHVRPVIAERPEEELARIYRIPIPSQPDLPISYNIAPSQEVLPIRLNPETKERSLDRLRWGLVPYWAKDEKIGFKTINARAERVFEKSDSAIEAGPCWKTMSGTTRI